LISVIQDFEDRVNEIDLYIEFVKDVHERGASLSLPNKARPQDRNKPISNSLTAVMKANIFLILYNLIEASIREGILTIYETMEREGCSYKNINDEIKGIWTKHQFKNCFDMNASWETYYGKAINMIDDVISENVVQLNRNAIPTSGNLCADQVRSICTQHGICTTVHRSARGGAALADVKEQRNLLAHGHLAFSECGRQFEIDQIDSFKNESTIFVRGILRNMSDFLDSKGYLHEGVA